MDIQGWMELPKVFVVVGSCAALRRRDEAYGFSDDAVTRRGGQKLTSLRSRNAASM